VTTKALIFDFDGLIVDSEIPAFDSWREIYQEYGCSLPLTEWAASLGGSGAEFDPCKYLEAQLGRTIDHAVTRARRWQRKLELLALQPALPGVEDYIHDAKGYALRLGIASSSSKGFISDQLTRLGLLDLFDKITCGDEVKRVKPDPELYERTLTTLGVRADEAIAFEDSPNGITAAKAAGIFCVAVPNALTAQLATDHADLRLPSLASITLDNLLAHVQRERESLSRFR
jgi:HAD superfamily hydrolase (TIGR01549 family)